MPTPLHPPLIPHARVVPPTALDPKPERSAALTKSGPSFELDTELPVDSEAAAKANLDIGTDEEPNPNEALNATVLPSTETETKDPQVPTSARESTGERVPQPSARRRWALALILILVSAALGVLLADQPGRSAVPPSLSGDLLLLVAERGLDVEPDRALTDRDAAQDFVRTETGLRIQPPRLDGPVLTGAGVARFAGGVPVPLFVIDVAGASMPVYAVTYAHLDSADGAVTLARPIANRIVARNVHVQPLGPAAEDALTALVWRDRATIYVALTDDPEAVVDRIDL